MEKWYGGENIRVDYIERAEFAHILAALTIENRLMMEASLATGLRVSDVLNLRTEKLKRRMTVRELKTGKARRFTLPVDLYNWVLSNAGKVWAFEGRLDYQKHKTRFAVHKDIKRACKAFRIPQNLQISLHTARKVYAVTAYQNSSELRCVQELLNHADEGITMLYGMADVLTTRRKGRGKTGGIVMKLSTLFH